ncbi:hypothetical protein ETH_00017235, partial [Eimeria tenella]
MQQQVSGEGAPGGAPEVAPAFPQEAQAADARGGSEDSPEQQQQQQQQQQEFPEGPLPTVVPPHHVSAEDRSHDSTGFSPAAATESPAAEAAAAKNKAAATQAAPATGFKGALRHFGAHYKAGAEEQQEGPPDAAAAAASDNPFGVTPEQLV